MSDKNLENTRRSLVELGGLARKTRAAEKQILARAEKRAADVAGRIDETPKTDPAYLELLEERARVERVIAQAKANLR